MFDGQYRLYAPGRQRRFGHAEVLRGSFILYDNDAPMFVNCLGPMCTIFAKAAEQHGNRTLTKTRGRRLKEPVNSRSYEVDLATPVQLQTTETVER